MYFKKLNALIINNDSLGIKCTITDMSRYVIEEVIAF